VELVAAGTGGCQFSVADLDPLGIEIAVELRLDGQASSGRGGGDELDDGLMAGKGTAAPG
jgi:hypothetical protein